MQLRGLRSVSIDGVDIGTCGPIEFEPITDPLLPNIITLPTRISGGFQCAPISREFIDALVGPPAPLTISTHHLHGGHLQAHHLEVDLRLIQQGKPRVFRYVVVGRLLKVGIHEVTQRCMPAAGGNLFSVAMEVEVEQA